MRFGTFLKIVLLTSGIGFLAVTYGVRKVRFYRADNHTVVEHSCESETEEQEANGEPALPPEEQRGCWSELDSNLNWEAIGQ